MNINSKIHTTPFMLILKLKLILNMTKNGMNRYKIPRCIFLFSLFCDLMIQVKYIIQHFCMINSWTLESFIIRIFLNQSKQKINGVEVGVGVMLHRILLYVGVELYKQINFRFSPPTNIFYKNKVERKLKTL